MDFSWEHCGCCSYYRLFPTTSIVCRFDEEFLQVLHHVQTQNNAPAPFWKKRLSVIFSVSHCFFPPPDAWENHPRCLGQLHVWREILRQPEQKSNSEPGKRAHQTMSGVGLVHENFH